MSSDGGDIEGVRVQVVEEVPHRPPAALDSAGLGPPARREALNRASSTMETRDDVTAMFHGQYTLRLSNGRIRPEKYSKRFTTRSQRG